MRPILQCCPPLAFLPFRRWLAVLALGLLTAACNTTGTTPNRQAANPIGLESNLRLARAALAGGDINSGLRLYRTAVADHPGAPDALRELADAYYAVRAYPEAVAAYRQLAALAPADPRPLLGLGRVALAKGDGATAATHFGEALALAPTDAQAQNGLAVAHDLRGAHDQAQVLYTELLARDPTNRAVANNLALSLALSGSLAQAIDTLAELSDGPTIMPEARHNLALAYALQGDENAAQRLLQRDLSQTAMQDTLAFYRGLGARTAGGQS